MQAIKELLPIGSIVLLKEADKALMICGVRHMHQETGDEYDYIGVIYPEGFLGEESHYLFQHEQIKEIVFLGYESDERKSFLAKLEDFYLLGR